MTKSFDEKSRHLLAGLIGTSWSHFIRSPVPMDRDGIDSHLEKSFYQLSSEVISGPRSFAGLSEP